MNELPPIVEFRQYTLHDGRRDELIALFEREFITTQEAVGITLIGTFRDADRPNRFVWMRGFPDMESRRRSLEAFYGGPCWREFRNAANATMIDSDNVLLLKPVLRVAEDVQAPLVAAIYSFDNREEASTHAHSIDSAETDRSRRDSAKIHAVLVSAYEENTFPALPVREGEHCVVVLSSGVGSEAVMRDRGPSLELVHLVPTTLSPLQST